MAHLSYKAIEPVEGGIQTVIDALLEAVGDSGTIVLPTFTFSFCESAKWNRQKTPSEMGIISELARNHKDAKRSCHPIYSVVAIGSKSNEYKNCNDSNGIGDKSPFAKLKKDNGIMALIGVGYNQGFVIGHHIEWKENVNYRYLKEFSGKVIDNGIVDKNTFSILVRDLKKGVLTDFRKLGYMLEHNGAMKVGRFGWAITRVIRAQKFSKLTRKWIKEEIPNLMHRKESEMSSEDKIKLYDDYHNCLFY